MTESPKPCGEDLILWPDGTTCHRWDLHEMTHMSDDYEVIPFDSDRWIEEISK